jgi:hypothetical protein
MPKVKLLIGVIIVLLLLVSVAVIQSSAPKADEVPTLPDEETLTPGFDQGLLDDYSYGDY